MTAEELLRARFRNGIKYPATVKEIDEFAEEYHEYQMSNVTFDVKEKLNDKITVVISMKKSGFELDIDS